MLIKQSIIKIAVLFVFTLSCVHAGDHPDFAKLHRDLTTAKEAWQTIPWHLSILEARTQAAKENKPVYMLCRAGHPLACV